MTNKISELWVKDLPDQRVMREEKLNKLGI
jgi:hypothetical protein